MRAISTFTLAFLDSFSFADLLRPARIPGVPALLFAPEGAEDGDREQMTQFSPRSSAKRTPSTKVGHAERT